ncbi:Transcriptional regulator of nonfermentable carbon utilization [Coemansia sp. RSA 2336]|nr:Transcriptional regulator of nonfermentable carbon utilization [Coemansia sp. RSA 2336]
MASNYTHTSHPNPAPVASDPAPTTDLKRARRKKRKTVRACNHCQKSHLTCDDSRPCARCVKRGLGDTCVDGVRKKAKYLLDTEPEANGSGARALTPIAMLAPKPLAASKDRQHTSSDPAALHTTPSMPNFGSEAINLEYAIMSNMLSYPTSSGTPALGADNPAAGATSTIAIPSSLWAAPASLLPLQSPPAQSSDNLSLSTNGSGQTAGPQPMRARQLSWQGRSLTHDAPPASVLGGLSALPAQPSPLQAHGAADKPQQLALSQRPPSGPAVHGLNPVYEQSPADVYSSVSEPYQYHTGFHFFFNYISTRMSKQDILRVSRAIAHFRPSLVALLRNLTRDDLIFMEKSFRRALLEYEKLIGFVGTPSVVWRRTGEIVLVGKEFSILTQWDRQELTAGKRFIFELMDAESAVVYWEQFAVHAFENSEHAVMSECRLVRPDGISVPCAFSFTIKRDLFGIPMAIHRDGGTANPGNTSSAHAETATTPNLHSRAVARERLRRQQQQQQQQQGPGGVMADLSTLHSQQNKDIHAVFAPTHDTIPASAYVSGHLSPADQWVAVASESSGVISLTDSDSEDDGAGSVPDYKGKQPSASYTQGVDLPYRHSDADERLSAADNAAAHNESTEQTIHLLRESVASLLSAANSPSSMSASSSRQHQLVQSASTSGRRDRRMHQGRSQSPSSLSKISEPCYLSSASHQRVTADLDRFSDIALSTHAMTAPPTHQRHLASTSRFRPPPPFPPYEEFKQHRTHPNASQWTHVSMALEGSAMAVPTAEQQTRHKSVPLADTVGDSTTAVNSSMAAHVGYGLHHRGIRNVPLSDASPRSPFASIRTVSPVLVGQHSPVDSLDVEAVSRARAEAALEQTILCPLSRTLDGYSRLDDKRGAPGESNNARQNWARYTGYAIVGFGVGTLVGMMCFDIAANSTPRATRTLPIATV